MADSRIAAAFIGGSWASGTWDEHSELDLYMVCDDNDYDGVFADRRDFLTAMGEVVLAEDFDGFGFDMVVFLLHDGVEGELALARSSGFGHIHGGPHQVLLDLSGLLDDVVFEWSRPDADQRRRSVEKAVAWFWRHMSLFGTAAARGKAWTAWGYLGMARLAALDLVWLLDAPEWWSGGLERIEDFPGTERAAPLVDTFVDLDLERLLEAAERLAEFTAEQGRLACAAVATVYPESLEATVRRKLRSLAQEKSTRTRST